VHGRDPRGFRLGSLCSYSLFLGHAVALRRKEGGIADHAFAVGREAFIRRLRIPAALGIRGNQVIAGRKGNEARAKPSKQQRSESAHVCHEP